MSVKERAGERPPKKPSSLINKIIFRKLKQYKTLKTYLVNIKAKKKYILKLLFLMHIKILLTKYYSGRTWQNTTSMTVIDKNIYT